MGYIWQGFGSTLAVTLAAVLIGLVLGFIVAMVKIAAMNNRWMKIPAFVCNVYTTVIRGTPVALQLFLMVFSVLAFPGFKPYAAILTFGINSGAYVSENIRAGILSVDKGQMEAARSLGLPYWKAMRKVVLPQAIRTMIPSIINQFIITLKDTSILSVIGFPELVNTAKNVVANTMRSSEVWFIVGVMYLIVITILSRFAKIMERRINRGRE